jgi:hypothetical protein
MGSLANQYISQSYTSLIHLGSDTTISSSYTDLQDGLGNTLNISVNAQGDISASGNIFAANLSAVTYDTGSLLTTASANLNTITFTKGNGSTFNVTVNTGSAGGSTDISSLNAFTASVAGTNTFTASIAGTNVFTQSAAVSIAALNAATSSYVTSAITASSLVTASFAAQTLTFTKGDGTTFGVVIPDVSGSTIDTGSFATTGSNAFVGNQTITGSLTISGSAQSDLTVVGQIFVSSSAATGTTTPRITVSGSAGRTLINKNSITTFDTTDNGGMFPSTIYTQDSTTADEIGFTVDPSVFSISGWSNGPAIYVQNPTDTFPAVIGFQNKANYTDGRVSVLTPLSASAGFTASLQNGYAWVGNSLGQNTQVPTSSFGTAINTGSFATTGSNTFTGIQNFNADITASNAIINGDLTVNPNTVTNLNGNANVQNFLYVGGGLTLNDTATISWLGSGIIDSTFSSSVDSRLDGTATTGSNTFVGNQTISGSLYIQSGSTFPNSTGSTLLTWNSSTGQVAQTPYSSALPALFDVGAFYSTITQSGSANVSGSFIYDNTIPINSIFITSGSHINIPNVESAYYNFQFSIQAVQGSGAADVAVWLKKNGANVPNTATYVTIPSNHKSLVALNLWDSGSAGDYFELAYQSDSANTTYQYIAPTGNIPGSPSVILTVNQVR